MQSKLLYAIAVCALAVPIAGCSRPWARPFSSSTDVPAEAAASANLTGEIPRAGSLEQSDVVQARSQTGQTDTTPDFAGVLDKLQQVREIDPAAERQLMESLRQAPPESWPLVAEQFRASLAYHKKLVASDQIAEPQGKNPSQPFAGQPFGSPGTSHPQQAAYERPSGPIGAFVDPRRSDADGVSSEALARATPYSMPAPGPGGIAAPLTSTNPMTADFATESTIYPMADKAGAGGQSPAVVPASLESSHGGLERQQSPAFSQAVEDENWQALVDRAIDDLSRRVATSPATTAEVHQHVSLRVLHLLAGDTERALEPIPHITPTEHDYWSKQLFALATYLDHHSQPDDKRRAAASVTHLDEAVSHLRELGSLSLRNLSFCKNVLGYGAIEAYDADQFSPSQHVSLYVEVENYHSKSTEKGYCTSLGSAYEILDDKGTRVGGEEIPDVNDCCRSRRRDFHIQYALTLPEKLTPGRYRLKLVIKDRQSDKMGHAEAAFEIKGIAP